MPKQAPEVATVPFRPTGDRILVLPAAPEAMSPGGIVIPDNAKEKQQRGTVVAVGNGRTLDDGSMNVPECEPGQEILFRRYAGNEIELDDQEFLVIEEKDMLGIFG